MFRLYSPRCTILRQENDHVSVTGEEENLNKMLFYRSVGAGKIELQSTV